VEQILMKCLKFLVLLDLEIFKLIQTYYKYHT